MNDFSHRSCVFLDLYAYNLEKDKWRVVVAQAGVAPTPRHSHSAVVYQDSMYVLGGELRFIMRTVQ